MYKRTKGQDSTKKVKSTENESVQRALELIKEDVAPISLVASPRTRVQELKAIFKAEYPQLDFHSHDVAAVDGSHVAAADAADAADAVDAVRA